jgi:3-isopropylmalate dehydrogenase
LTKTLAVLPGDGVGPEVTEAALQVLDAVNEAFELDIDFFHRDAGGVSIERHGEPITSAVVEECRRAGATLLGAVGGPAWDHLPPRERPERALLRLRKELDLYANLRPVRVPEALVERSALRPDAVRGTDLIVVRELTSGLYYGEPRGRDAGRAWNTMAYTRGEIERIARQAFEIARTRRRKVTSVDKANVLEVSALWRDVVTGVGKEFGDVELEHVLVDAMAMHLVLAPTRFDVILTENLFGDILSDEAAVLGGSLGLLPSASIGENGALYEPVHGSAPDIAGKGWANPLGAIGSLALALRHSFGAPEAARAVDRAIDETLADGPRTRDLGGTASTSEVAAHVVNRVLVRVVED